MAFVFKIGDCGSEGLSGVLGGKSYVGYGRREGGRSGRGGRVERR